MTNKAKDDELWQRYACATLNGSSSIRGFPIPNAVEAAIETADLMLKEVLKRRGRREMKTPANRSQRAQSKRSES